MIVRNGVMTEPRDPALTFVLLLLNVLLVSFTVAQEARDLVTGNLIQFNENGAWCWYQDERAVVDVKGKKLIVGSVAGGTGFGGSARNGEVDAVMFDLQTGQTQRFALMKTGCDDHNAPAFLVRPDGRYLAVYTTHYDTLSRYRIYDGVGWSSEQRFSWRIIPGGLDFSVTYSNPYYLSSEGRVHNFARSKYRSPNMIVSTDMGYTWSYGGVLTQPDVNIGYVNGYFKYWGNGVDRIDFLCTEHHPRDYNTSMYHGYIKNGKSYRSDGTMLDANISDTLAPKPRDFTLVFAANTIINGVTMTRCWNSDVQSYDDGTVAAIIKARANNSETDHRFIYCRYDGSKWSYTYLGKAGAKMYSSEQDYVGLGALHPDDPSTIYLSMPFDPRDDANLGVREIFKGVTADNGATWSWTPITRNSVRDNFRPIVPAWDKNNTALLWWRGTYYSAGSFDAAVVGILERREEIVSKMIYVDATTSNTTLSTGALLMTTGPDANMGAADNQWHIRTGYGNGSSVLTSAEIGGENAPALRTRAAVASPGTYDVWVNFWANPSADWRIKAGLSQDRMMVFRQMASKQVEAGERASALTLSGAGNTYLYQAYLGRVQLSAGETLTVFVDDEATQTGTLNTLVGNTCRTWYDGISYARIENAVTNVGRIAESPSEFALNQNYPNPFNPSTTISFSLPRDGHVTLEVYDMLGRETAALIDGEMRAGTHEIVWNAGEVSAGVYFYRIVSDGLSRTRSMIFVK